MYHYIVLFSYILLWLEKNCDQLNKTIKQIHTAFHLFLQLFPCIIELFSTMAKSLWNQCRYKQFALNITAISHKCLNTVLYRISLHRRGLNAFYVGCFSLWSPTFRIPSKALTAERLSNHLHSSETEYLTSEASSAGLF